MIDIIINDEKDVQTIINSKTIIDTTINKSGPRGLSAYEIWLQNGGLGTEIDFLNSLKISGTFSYEQMIPSTEWHVEHNLKGYPSVTVVDSAGSVVYGEVYYIDENNLKVIFNVSFSGQVYLN